MTTAARTRQYTVTLILPRLTEIHVRQQADDGTYWVRRLRRRDQP